MATPQEILDALGHFGYITPEQRTQSQADAHQRALAGMPKLAMPKTTIPVGTKIMLTDYWKNPLVIPDIGAAFIGFHQITGSCVGASCGDAVATLSCVQRTIADAPTKAMLPWWPFDYGRCRLAEGDRGQGEGAVDSVMGQTILQGVLPYPQSGLPAFGTDDGLYLTSQIEMAWSDGSTIPAGDITIAKQFPVGTVTPVNSPDDIANGIANGYPTLYGCSRYIGHGQIKGEGQDAYVVGHYDGNGGHSTCFLGVWNHPTDGMLFLYSNQWPTDTYPTDPAGAGRCCVWTTESEVAKVFSRYGGGDGESMALSHLNYFPAQPAVISGFI
jgi:hypothetical protein